jgi:hypothetical protein
MLRPVPFRSIDDPTELGRVDDRALDEHQLVGLRRRAGKLHGAFGVEQDGDGTRSTWRVPITKERRP